MNDQINKAIGIIMQGGVVIFPTDTAFGIGCRMDDADAVNRLFGMRKRPPTQATPVLVSDFLMAKDYLLEIPENVEKKLIEPYWPGALTVVLPCRTDKVP